MSKKLLLSFSLIFAALSMEAQEVKRYLTFEHFTNTVCSICASRNPGFIAKINQFPDDVHHISFHPPVPYTTCQLYQANHIENGARADYYGVTGTPKVWLNGTYTGSQMVTDQQINDALALTSPVGIAITETTGNTREVNVTVRSYTEAPVANYKLNVAIVEKTLNYNAPNGETVHHNVFRKFLANGVDFTPAAAGQAMNFTYNYDLDSEWGADEIYVLAYIQNDDTKEVLNSGTRFDPALPVSNKNLKEEISSLEVAPNPASDQIFITLSSPVQNDALLSLQNASGRVVWTSSEVSASQNLSVGIFPSGLYFLSLQNGGERMIKKVVIQ